MNRRFFIAALAVLAPMAFLCWAWWSSQRALWEAGWSRLHGENAPARAKECLAELEAALTRDRSWASKYSDPPRPPADAADSGRFQAAGEDPEALRALRDDPAAGPSPAGLPQRTLAAAALLKLEPTPANATALQELALGQGASLLTPRILEEASSRAASLPDWKADWRERWDRQERDRAVARRHPEMNGGWVKEEDGAWWLQQSPEGVFTISPAEVTAALAACQAREGNFTVSANAGEGNYGKNRNQALATASSETFTGLRIALSLDRPPPADERVWNQFALRRFLLVLVPAAAFSLAGLWALHRLLARERRLNELKSHFVASVSHELRAPVGSIRLMADALDAGKVAPGTATEFHRLISRESARLSTLIENVLDFARIEQDRKVWRMESTDIRALLLDTVRVMEPLAEGRSIRLEATPGDFDREPSVDSGAIQQALVNLLDNAIKFSPSGSGVTAGLSHDAVSWSLWVRDEGPGIPAAEHAHVFERFYRSGNELRRETQGTGIGLSLVKAIAEAHGGKVELDSAPGHGSTFTLRFPFSA